MDVKLTLRLDDHAVKAAKKYAAQQKTSLSKLIERYFQVIVGNVKDDDSLTPIVRELYGVAADVKAKASKKNYVDYLNEKYK